MEYESANILDSDCLSSVFRHLAITERLPLQAVSQRWNTLILSSIHHLSDSDARALRMLSPGLIINPFGPQLLSLTIDTRYSSDTLILDECIVYLIVTLCSRIGKFECEGCEIPFDSVIKLSELKSLEVLTLHRCFGEESVDEALAITLSELKSLRELSVDCTFGYEFLKQASSELEVLKIQPLNGLCANPLLFREIFRGHAKLVEFCIEKYVDSVEHTQEGELTMVRALAESCLQLRRVTFEYCEIANLDEFLLFKNLCSLKLPIDTCGSDRQYFNDELFVEICKRNPIMEEFDFGGRGWYLTKQAFIDGLGILTGLKRVFFRRDLNRAVDDEVVSSICSASASSLRHISLGATRNLSRMGPIAIGRFCRVIETIEIGGSLCHPVVVEELVDLLLNSESWNEKRLVEIVLHREYPRVPASEFNLIRSRLPDNVLMQIL